MKIIKARELEKAREFVVKSGVRKYFRLKYLGLIGGLLTVRVYSTIGAFSPYNVVRSVRG